ncbi:MULTISPECIES: DUF3955 domain-containing protein [unclassified Oceanispirochaeta]|uniref:DUF3955 domain-containing protein n=1 Tax=unclassified Oceanispirochaeta TaxID=2635722 RepID=UPI000E096D0E|nr:MULTISPECIES: DUF3955 domain-containing protein [unclassified Oceanispirochaeta]MBF9017741.1 DUF3955 domain-containing protein [Oceanispirochaeta sp. M2]NPD72144.1 DUF3955 domain-containing protein [Oceanispirochaeta sp. M1]RDG32585.1 DUF3955 domain-containing protein [Oceanispirochaeta sp. M1]
MKKITIISITTFIISLICLISFRIIGSSIAEDGTLVEPFGLIPIGYMFLIISIVSGVAAITKSAIYKLKK